MMTKSKLLLAEAVGDRDGAAVEPKWTRAHHTSQLCKASCCMAPATWEIWVEVVPGIMFNVHACNKHAGKAISDEEIAREGKRQC